MKILPENRDLLNDNGLDEMQKSYAYQMAFKCFKALYWSVFAMSMIMLVIATAIEKSVIFSVTAIATELVASIVYVVFGSKASKVGALNPKFAKAMGNPSAILGYILLTLVYFVWFAVDFMKEGELYYIFCGIYMLIFAGTFIILGFIAKKNNKVLEEQTKEDKEDE